MRIQKIFKAIFFNKDGFEEEAENLNIHIGVISFLINVFIFVIPTNKISLQNLHTNFIVAFLGFLILTLIVYVIICILKKRIINFLEFFIPVQFFFMASLLMISVPAFIISHWLVNIVLKNQILGLFLFTLIPYYNLVLFGWLSETASHEKGLKAVIIALVAITLLLAYQNLLVFFTI